MIDLIKSVDGFAASKIVGVWDSRADQVLAFMRKDLLFIFNFNPSDSFSDYGLLVPQGSYEIILDTDDSDYGGHARIDDGMEYFTSSDPLYMDQQKGWLRLYLPSRCGLVLKKK